MGETPNTAVQNDLATRPAKVEFSASLPQGCIGPYSVDEWSFVTDRVGFLAISGASHPAPPLDQQATMSRRLLSIFPAAGQTVKLQGLREFIRERLEVSDDCRVIECSVFGCPVDVRVVDKWLAMIPAEECSVASSFAPTRQKEQGESLFFEGDSWKLLIAGLKPSLKYPPVFDAGKAEGR